LAVVSVINNGLDFSVSSIVFYWIRSVIIQNINPTVVFESGGVDIDIFGAGFVPTFPNVVHCRFAGMFVVDALYMSSTNIKCTCPANQPGNITVEVTQNGQDYILAGSLNYIATPRLLSLAPSVGPWRGNTLVTLTFDTLGDILGKNGSAFCVFGSKTVASRITSENFIQCLSPASGKFNTFYHIISYRIILPH